MGAGPDQLFECWLYREIMIDVWHGRRSWPLVRASFGYCLQLSLPIHGLTLAHISIVIFLEIVIVRELTTLVAASSDLQQNQHRMEMNSLDHEDSGCSRRSFLLWDWV